MAQSRPTTTTDGAKALAKTIVDLQKRVRTLELREDPTGGGGGTSGNWCVIQDNRGWVSGSGVGQYALAADMTPFAQSGGFSLVDAQTLAVPDGIYVVEWSFKFEFFFVNPYSSGFFGNGWTTWRGGVSFEAGSVLNYTAGEQMIAPVEYVDYGGGDASMRTINSGSAVFKWTGLIAAGGSLGGSNLQMAITDFSDLFKNSLDWSNDFIEVGTTAADGSGRYNVVIASVGD